MPQHPTHRASITRRTGPNFCLKEKSSDQIVKVNHIHVSQTALRCVIYRIP